MLELVFELLFQIVFEFALELPFELFKSRTGRRVFSAAFMAACGFAGGFWWGDRLSELGRTDPPRALWISIGLSVVFVALAVWQWQRGNHDDPSGTVRAWDWAEELLPWRWSAVRLLVFAFTNAAVAAGMAAGFQPQAVPLG